MSVETGLNLLKTIYGIASPGVCHGDDLGYLFQVHQVHVEIEPGSPEEIGFRRFVKLWTNFAKNGNPNNTRDPLTPVHWKPVSKDLHFLDIGLELTAGSNPESERLRFWDEVLKINPVHKL